MWEVLSYEKSNKTNQPDKYRKKRYTSDEASYSIDIIHIKINNDIKNLNQNIFLKTTKSTSMLR